MLDRKKPDSPSKRSLAVAAIQELADHLPRVFEDFWDKAREEQDGLVALYGTLTDLASWRQRNG